MGVVLIIVRFYSCLILVKYERFSIELVDKFYKHIHTYIVLLMLAHILLLSLKFIVMNYSTIFY